MKNNECFDCLNHGKGKLAENTGWYHLCKLGIENEGLHDIEKCKEFKPNKGFQVGGYYTHMHFEFDEHNPTSCVELIMHSDGLFPTDNPDEMIQFHICDFGQIERWVKFWGKYLRERNVLIKEEVCMKNTKTDYERILNDEKGNNYGTQLRDKDLPLFNTMYHKWKLSQNLETTYETKRGM